MCSFRVVLLTLSFIPMAGRWKCIAGVGFLPKRVTDVSLVCKDVMDATPPPLLILSTEYACLIQSAGDALLAVSIQIPLEYFANGHRLLWNNYNFFIYDPISIRYGRCEIGTGLHPAPVAPSHIAGDGFALLLGEGGIDGGDELTAHIGGVNALALEADIDAQLLQLPHCLQAVLCVPGETGDGFDEDLVDESSAAVRHHALEVLPLCGGGAGDALVGVDIHHAPLSLAGD